jgi:hypothetical protein
MVILTPALVGQLFLRVRVRVKVRVGVSAILVRDLDQIRTFIQIRQINM